MKVIFQKACNLHIKRDLRDAHSATRREPARTHMDPLNSTRTLKCGTLLGNKREPDLAELKHNQHTTKQIAFTALIILIYEIIEPFEG